jgi:hypothetical protein
MNSDAALALAVRLMSDFAMRTGVTSSAPQRRYLWTDAFAVCNFIELFRRTNDRAHLQCATELIGEVHRVLGRYRAEDVRRGWISGLDDEAGRQHPTAAGLRIGKPLKERAAAEPMNERLEWDRDGQYFHYLTKWMHALSQAAFVTGDPAYARWAVELAEAAFKGFGCKTGSGETIGIYWKMSTDLSRPLVSATGLHDALDGFITFRQVRHARTAMQANAGNADLDPAIQSLSRLCRQGNWMTDDPLGLGGLLFDAWRLFRLPEREPGDGRLLEEITDACRHGLTAFLASGQLRQPTAYRLAFRELGLAIGLRTLPDIADALAKDRGELGRGSALQRTVAFLLSQESQESIAERIVSLWAPYAQGDDEGWRTHRDINDVMLAAALIPNALLIESAA